MYKRATALLQQATGEGKEGNIRILKCHTVSHELRVLLLTEENLFLSMEEKNEGG